MQKQILDLMNQYNESVMSSAKRLGELNLKTYERFASKQVDIMNQCIESASTHMDVLGNTSDVNELAETQTSFTKGCGEQMAANLRDYTEMFNDVRDELTSISEEAVSVMTVNAEKAGELMKEAA